MTGLGGAGRRGLCGWLVPSRQLLAVRGVAGLAATILAAVAVLALPQRAATAQPLIVATEPQATAAPLIIANERGWFAEEGLDVRIVHFHANRTMVMSLVEGDVDIGLIKLTADAFATAASRNLRVIAGVERLDADRPRYAWLLSADLTDGGPGGQAFDTLSGRPDAVFGLSEPGSAARYLLHRRLAAGTPPPDYLTAGSDVALAAALSEGTIDAALLPANLAADLEATGAGVVAGWAGASEGQVSLSVLMASAVQARLRPDVMHRFMRAYVRGVRAYHAMVLDIEPEAEGMVGAERTAMLQVIAAGARRPASEVAAALPYIAADGWLDAASLAEQLAWWQEQGECQQDIAVQALVDLTALDAAIASLAADEAAAEASRRAAQRQASQQAGTGGVAQILATDASAAGGPQQDGAPGD